MRPIVEVKASELLEQYNIIEPPVPIEEIVVARGIAIARNHFKGTESGFALRNGSQQIIGVNTLTSPRRQRFSIAHELGHLLLHDGKPLIVDHSIRINERNDLSRAGTNREEIEANGFAATILMPEDMLRRKLRDEFEYAEYDRADSRDELLARLAREFDVSAEAMGFRLINLRLISA